MDKPDKINLVRKLVAEKLSAGEIAARIAGASRNAIIGFCHREKIALRGKTKILARSSAPPKSNVVPLVRPKRRARNPKANDAPGEVVVLPVQKKNVPKKEREVKGTISIIDMPLLGRCRGPLNDDFRGAEPRKMLFCGEVTEPESSWCRECQKKFTTGRVKMKKIVSDNGEPILSKSPKRRPLYRWLR